MNQVFSINYTPQDKQVEYHAIGSGSFVHFMQYLYNGFPLSCRTETEMPLEERIERYKQGDLNPVEMYILALDYLIHEAVYGGSRGGGKSYADAGEAAMLANIFPGIKIGIFRKTYTSLNESITDKLVAMLPKELKDKPNGWKYVKKDNQIKFLHNDSVIKLCYCESYQDALKYRGWEFDMIIIDEECDLDDKTVNFLKGTLRTAKYVTYEDGTPVRYPEGHPDRYIRDAKTGEPTEELAYVKYPVMYRASVNPEGPGFIRVRDEFVKPTKYGKEVLEIEKTLRNGVKKIRRRAFIQAKMEDNKYLNEDYELQFSDMSEAERLKNVEGNWDVSDTNFFRKFKSQHISKGGHIINSVDEILSEEEKLYVKDGEEFPDYFECYGSLDWGFYPDYAALSVFYVGGNHVVKRYELLWQNLAINEAAEHILFLQQEYNFRLKMLFVPHDMARAGEKYYNSKMELLGDTKEKVLIQYGIPTSVTRSERAEGWDKVHQLHSEYNDDGTPLYKVHSSCVKTIAQYQTLARDEIKYKDIRNGQEDHCADSERYFAVPYSKFLNTQRKVIKEQSYREKLINKFSNQKTKSYSRQSYISQLK